MEKRLDWNRISKNIKGSIYAAVCLVISILMSLVRCSVTDPYKDQAIRPPEGFGLIDSEPAWSSDGKTIAYFHGSSEPGVSGIYFIDPEGSNRRQFHAGVAESPSWSPDGEWIAYSKSVCEGPRSCGKWIMDKDGEQHKFVDDSGNYPEWHPLDNKVLYITRAVTQQGKVIGDSLWVYDVDSNIKTFFSFPGKTNYDNRYSKYSPDGIKIAFTSKPYAASNQVWVMDADRSKPKQPTTTGGYTSDWSPDGEWIVFTDTGSESARLWLMRKDGTDKRQLTFD
jgi:Tol biopolymer transport system component